MGSKHKSAALHLTTQQIAELNANPCVKDVRENRITLTFEFRTLHYDTWEKDPCINTPNF